MPTLIHSIDVPMKKLLTFLFLLTTVSCFGQIKELRVDFAPSFLESSQVYIENINSIYTMTIMNSKINETHYVSESLMAELNQLLADYPQNKVIEDSLLRIKNHEEMIKQRQTMKKELVELLESMVIVATSDGIGVWVNIVDKNGSKTYNMSNPNKGTINHTFMKLLFKLMNQSFWGYQTETYVEKLEGYFSFGLGVKKQDNSNYKLYGWISPKEEKELNELFAKLPSDIPLYFNMQNFEGMDKMFYPSFKSLCDRNPKITWSGCSDKVKQQFKEAGIVNLTPMGYSVIQY